MSSKPTSPSSSKRPSEASEGAEAKKRPKLDFDFDSKFIATSQDDLDTGLLRVQNRRLAERLVHRQRVEDELRARIEQLEKKQLNEDTKLYAINRYWNQLNEDMRLLLERFEESSGDSEDSPRGGEDGPSNGSDEPNESGSRKGAHEETTSFVRQLANCDKEELDEALQQRVLLSTRAVSKVLQAFDRIVKRNERVMSALKAGPEPEEIGGTSDHEDIGGDGVSRKRALKPNLDTEVRELNEALTRENQRLNCLVTSLHEKHRAVNLKSAQLSDALESRELQVDELKNRIDELEFELNKSRTREQRLEVHLYETREKLRDFQGCGAGDGIGNGKLEVGLSSNKLEDLRRELEEQRELACSRIAELETLNATHKETLRELEKQKMDMACLPETVVRETSEYKSLQSRFSVLFNESMQLKNQLEEARQQLTTAKNIHLRQIEQMESDELSFQKKLRTECMQLEDSLAQVRKEYELLRLEFEQNLAAHEQTGPINKEMRHLISSLQNHIGQLKGENVRVKRKLKEANLELARLRQIIEDAGLRVVGGGILLPSPLHLGGVSEVSEGSLVGTPQFTSDSSNDGTGNLVIQSESSCDENATRKVDIKQEPAFSPPQNAPIKREPVDDTTEGSLQDYSDSSKPDLEVLRDLKAQLKKSHEAERELKLLLDMYKFVDKEKRDKVVLMASEKRFRLEIEDLRQQLNKAQEAEKKGNRRRCNDEEYREKVTKYEEAIAQLQRNVTIHKQQEEALLNEMEVTGQAFEDMQEQNCRLLQQLREKDDANFKLMSERIKSNQIHKLLKEEKEAMTEHVIHLENQVDAQNQVVRKLEDKERILQASLATIEKELAARQNLMDHYKRKAMEASQNAADLKLHLDKYVAQIKDAQSIVADKTTAWQQETFKTKRLHEEVAHYRRKYERAKKFELATTADEVLQEEIRELREELTCPSCKTKRKDAVLNKCFHVFCYDCLKTRYETRQRKCPKCNQSFSANDFHRLYLA